MSEDSGQSGDGTDREEIEKVAFELGEMRVSLARNSAISDELAKSIKDKKMRLLDALPSEVEVHRDIQPGGERDV